MDLAVTLVKSVMRAFYQPREILVIDALILHEALRDDDLSYLMQVNNKDLHKICGKLREDRFLVTHTRPEAREGVPGGRPINKTWYYINYRHTIDAIKWRVYNIDKEVQGTAIQVDEKKEYFCHHCKAEWSQMEVLDHSSPQGFLCHRCNHVLTFEKDRNPTGHEQSTRLNDQFKFITELLQKIDTVRIDECNFDKALAKQRPVKRDATNQRMETVAIDTVSKPMAVKGLTNIGPQSINVNISTAEGQTEAEKEAERARKEQAAKQNALPSWMLQSTVSGESFAGANPATSVPVTKKEEQDVKKDTKVEAGDAGNPAIDDIFEKLKAEQAAERAREEMGVEDSDSEGDEDEGEFEDVPTGINSSRNTTSTPNIKREASGEPSRSGDSSDERTTKRVKIEPEVKSETNSKALDSGEPSDEDDDEELEFEDV